MNCRHHHRIFATQPRNYRDLPLRLAEVLAHGPQGTCYRYEQSGDWPCASTFGLLRVRSLNLNDAHVYCTVEQFAEEFNAVNEMDLKYFKIFGLAQSQMRFSTRDPARLTGDPAKSVNEPDLWNSLRRATTEDIVREVLKSSGIRDREVPSEGGGLRAED